MIPNEVAIIADILLDEFGPMYRDESTNRDQFIKQAYRIYNALDLCKCVAG